MTAAGASTTEKFRLELEYARARDAKDPLRGYRDRFHIPAKDGREYVYFTGNSLGLQPRAAKAYIEQELSDWADHGVEGHFRAKFPWVSYHEFLTHEMAAIVGAEPDETVVMNQLTVNLHLLMVSFYRPTASRFRILCEARAFPSDAYAIRSQIRFRGFDPADALIEVSPRPGEHCIRDEDVCDKIRELGDSLALVLIGGVNYLTGQVFDMKAITKATHEAGAVAGFDLAHAAGNIQLKLHDWDVDFAAWCSYKYLNSGPGGVAGAFVHRRHLSDTGLPLFAGWWGHDKKSRFLMSADFVPMETAERWQLSNAPVLSMAACRASLAIFAEAGMDALTGKSRSLTEYLEFAVEELNRKHNNCLEIITPRDARGCQLSIVAHGYGRSLYDRLSENGIMADWREPNVIRCAPVPLYNRFEDVFLFAEILDRLL
jgi:kynureninase